MLDRDRPAFHPEFLASAQPDRQASQPFPPSSTLDTPCSERYDIWNPQSYMRKEAIEALGVDLSDSMNSDRARMFAALSDPVFENRDAAAVVLLRSFHPLHHSKALSADGKLQILRGVFSFLGDPVIPGNGLGERDPRIPTEQRYDFEKTLAHTRLMALRLLQRAVQFSPGSRPPLAAYLETVEQEHGFLPRHEAVRVAQQLSRPMTTVRTAQLPDEILSAPSEHIIWRVLQTTHAFVKATPSLTAKPGWARSLLEAWRDCAPVFEQFGRF